MIFGSKCVTIQQKYMFIGKQDFCTFVSQNLI